MKMHAEAVKTAEMLLSFLPDMWVQNLGIVPDLASS